MLSTAIRPTHSSSQRPVYVGGIFQFSKADHIDVSAQSGEERLNEIIMTVVDPCGEVGKVWQVDASGT